MATPTPVLNARERLIKSIQAACIFFNVPYNVPFLEMIAVDLFGDPTLDIARAPNQPTSAHIGPIGQLAMWFALYWEESGLGAPGATIPAGIQIDPRLLIPLLSLHPTTFGTELYHQFKASIFAGGDLICGACNRTMPDHFHALQKLLLAEIESLVSDIEVLEATMDIQMQAIVKQTEAIEALTEAKAKECPHDRSSGDGEQSSCTRCGVDRTQADYGPFKDDE